MATTEAASALAVAGTEGMPLSEGDGDGAGAAEGDVPGADAAGVVAAGVAGEAEPDGESRCLSFCTALAMPASDARASDAPAALALGAVVAEALDFSCAAVPACACGAEDRATVPLPGCAVCVVPGSRPAVLPVLPEGLADGGDGAGVEDASCGAAPPALLPAGAEAISALALPASPWPAAVPGVPGGAGTAPDWDAIRDELSRPSPSLSGRAPALPEPEVPDPETCGAFEACGACGTTSELATVAAMLAEPADGVAALPDPLLCAVEPLLAACPRFCAGPLVAREIREAPPALEALIA